VITASLCELTRGQEDIKSALRDLQKKEAERWSRVDILMAFLQDLRQAIADRDRGKMKKTQAFAGPRLGPGF
jgi:hypothetical protein